MFAHREAISQIVMAEKVDAAPAVLIAGPSRAGKSLLIARLTGQPNCDGVVGNVDSYSRRYNGKLRSS